VTEKARDVSRKPTAARGSIAVAAAKHPAAKRSFSPRLEKPVHRAVATKRRGQVYSVELPAGVHGEIARLAIHGVLDRLAEVPQREATRILANARGAGASAVRVMDWLRVEDRGVEPSETTRTALEAAFRRGDARKAAILRDPTMLTGEAAAARLGVSRETINKREQQGRLLALEFAKRGKRYPEWQFEESIAGRPLEAVLAALGSLGNWERYRFFTQRQPGLGDRTPVDALRGGAVEAVRSVALGWAAGEQGGG